jgi:WD40 repeat protein
VGEPILYIWDIKWDGPSSLRPPITIRPGCQRLAWSPDGKLLAVGSDEGVDLYNPTSGEPYDRLPGGGFIRSIAWYKDSTKLAALTAPTHADRADQLCLWAMNDREHVVKEKLADVYSHGSVFWSPDGNTIVTTNAKTMVQLWDGKSGKLKDTLELKVPEEYGGDHAYYPRWSKDGKRLEQLANWKGYWDAATGKWMKPMQSPELLRTFLEERLTEWISAWSPDGKQFITIDGFWDATTGRRRGSRPIAHPGEGVGSWSPDGKSVAVFAGGLGLWGSQVWSVEPGPGPRPLLSVPASAFLSWSPDNKRAICLAGGSGMFFVLDIATSKYHWLALRKEGARSSEWSADGRRIAVIGTRIDTSNDYWVVVLKDRHPGAADWTEAWTKKVDRMSSLAWSPTDNDILAYGSEGELFLRDGRTKAEVKRSEAKPSGGLAWSPDGRRLAGRGWVWEAPTLKRLCALEGSEGYDELKWSADGKTILARDRSWVVSWDAESGKRTENGERERWLPWQGQFVVLANGKGMAISPAGHYRASDDIVNDIVYVVQTKDGQETLTPKGFKDKYGWANDPSRVRLADQ